MANLSPVEQLQQRAIRQNRLDRAARKGLRYGAYFGAAQGLAILIGGSIYLCNEHGWKAVSSGEIPLLLLFTLAISAALAAFGSLIGSNVAIMYVEYFFPDSRLGD